MEFALPRLYRFQEEPTDRELKKKVGSDYIKAKRLKDGKSVRIKFHEVEDDVTSEEFLGEGASEIEVKSDGILGKSCRHREWQGQGRPDRCENKRTTLQFLPHDLAGQ
jgi:hypothetical protein